MNKLNFEGVKHWVLVVILAVFGYFMLMYGNGSVSLTHPDEVFYIESAKDMLRHNSWFTPMIFDEIQFEKPFIAFALFMTAIKMFGLTPEAARFFPALFAIIGVIGVYGLTWILFQRKRAAFLAGIILGSSFIYMALARAVLTDMIFSVWVLLSLFAFAYAYYRPKFTDLGIYISFVFAAIAVLTKGLLGICFPATAILLFLICNRDLKFLLRSSVLWGGLLFLLISVPWHVIMYQKHGDFFLYEYFGNVHIRRLIDSEHPKINTWYFYPGLMFGGVMPWSIFWIPTIVWLYSEWRRNRKLNEGVVFLLVWMLAVFSFVQPAASKLASYVFPLFPAIAALLAVYIDKALQESAEGKKTFLPVWGGIWGFIVLGIAIGGVFAGNFYSDFLGDLRPVYFTVALVVAIAAYLIFFAFKKRPGFMLFGFPSISIALLVMLTLAQPLAEPWVSCYDISDKFKKIDGSDTPVLASKFYVRGIRYYTDRPMAVIDINGGGFWSPHPIPFLSKDEQVADFFAQRPGTYAIVKESNVEDIRRIVKNYKFSLDELEGIGGKHILRIKK
jgi:4-amino-4-deoxy-L-arabinose transferase-like glycosyltransferase